jgi:hypothetical protein
MKWTQKQDCTGSSLKRRFQQMELQVIIIIIRGATALAGIKTKPTWNLLHLR